MFKTTALTLFLIASALLLTSCKTQFYGSPKVPGGRAGCQSVCDGLGMELAGMVVMGEYSDGCICEVPRESSEERTSFVLVGADGAMAAAAGVMMQMDDEDEEQRRNND